MRINRLFTGADGSSRMEPVEISLPGRGLAGLLSEPEAAAGVFLREYPPGFVLDWHTAPRRQYLIHLEGAVEVETGDGLRHRIGPGEVVLAEDTAGKGHITRGLGAAPVRVVTVTLE